MSISLRAKIKPARDLHIGTARLVRAGFVERGATAFGIIMFNLACSWSTCPWLERHQTSGTSCVTPYTLFRISCSQAW